jgi:D-inositol-3-phosphate glycosyltransferase
MKILIVSEYYWPHIGGVQIVFKNLAEGLVKQGHEVQVVTSRVKNTKRFEKLNGVDVHRVWVPVKADRYFFTLTSLFKVWRLAGKADVIHGTLYNAAIPTWFAAKLRRKKSVLSVHEVFGSRWVTRFETSYLFAKIHQILENFILKFKFPSYICVSKSTAKDFASHAPKKSLTEVIYNGIDHELFDPTKYKPAKNKKFTYLFYGRPGISKGAEVLVRTAAKVRDKCPETRLKMILAKQPVSGYEQVIKLIKELDLESYIELLDPVPYQELPKHLVQADTVVVPSLAEGFGFTAAETSAMERPLVVSKTASLPEVASGKVVFVKAGDSEDLARGMMAAYRGKFKKIAKKTFSWDKNVTEHLALYKKLLTKNKKLRVAMLIDAWFPLHGGGQVHVKRLAEELADKVEIDVFTRNLKGEKIPKKEGVYRLGRRTNFHNPLARIAWLFQVYFAVKKAHKERPYDLIHAQAFTPGLPGKLLQKRLSLPLVYTVHGTSLFHNPRGVTPFIERFLVSKIKYDQEITVASNFLKLKNRNKDIAVIPNGVDLQPFKKINPKKPREFTVLFIGRLDPIKGLNILIEALRDWDFKKRPLKVRIVGDGPARKELERQAGPNIKFLGKQTGETAIKEYKKAHLFVLPSFSEGQPLTILEAFAAKCPVLATQVGDNEKVVINEKTGFLVPPQDKNALKGALKKAFDLHQKNPTKYKCLGENGYNKIQKEYTWNRTASETYKIYETLISGR